MGVTVKELLIAVRTDMAGLKAGMDTMQKETNRSKTANDNLGLSVDDVGKKLKKLAAFVGAGVLFKAVITSASDFGASIGNMATLITDSNVNIGEMEQGFLDLAGPLGSAKELADAAYGALSAGVPASEAVEFIGTAAAFAKANLVDLNSAVDVVTTIMNTYGAAAGSAAEITDTLTTTIRLGKTTGEELSASLGNIAGTAKTVGISFTDLNAAIVVMTSGGIKTTQAVTSLKAVISNIATPSKLASDAAEKLGINFSLAGLESKGLSGFIQELTASAKGDVQAQKDLFGSIEAFNAIAVLASEEGAAKFIDAQKEIKKSTDATKIALEKQQGTFASVMEGLKNKVEAVVIQAVLPALKDLAGILKDPAVTEGIASAIRGVVEIAKSIGTAASLAIEFLGRVRDEAALIGPVLSTISDGWSAYFAIVAGEENRGLDAEMAAIIRNADQLKVTTDNYNSMRDALELTTPEMRSLTAAFNNIENPAIRMNKIMQAIRDGDFDIGTRKLSDAYKEWNEKLKDSRSKTSAVKKEIGGPAGLTAEIKVQESELKKLNSEMVTYISKLGLLSTGDITEAKKQIDFLSAAFLSDTAEAEANRKQLVLNEGALKNVTKEVQGIIDKFKSMSMEVPPQAQALVDKIASIGVSADLAGDHMEELDTDFLDSAKSMEDFAGEAELLPPIIGDMGEETVVLGGTLEDLMEDLDAANKIFSSFAGILGDTTGAMDTFISVVGGIGDFAAGFAMGDPVAMASGLLTVIGSIADVVGSTDWAGYAQAEAKALGISSEMGDRLASLAEEMHSVNGALFVMMDEIIVSENIKGQDDFLKWLVEVERMLGKVVRGADVSEFSDAMGALLESAPNVGFLGREFVHFADEIAAAGVELESLNEFMENEMIRGAEGYAAFMEAGFSDAVLPTLQDVLDFQTLLADNSALVAGVEGWADSIEALGNTGNVTFDNFDILLGGTLDSFDALIAAGFTEKQALETMQPQLAALIGLSEDYGFAIDAETQALIDKGREFGIQFGDEKSANDIIADQMTKLVNIFEKLLPDSLETFGDAGEAVFGKYQTWTNLATLQMEGVGASVRGVADDLGDVGDAIDMLDSDWTDAVSGNTILKENDKWKRSLQLIGFTIMDVGEIGESLGQGWDSMADGISTRNNTDIKPSIYGIGTALLDLAAVGETTFQSITAGGKDFKGGVDSLLPSIRDVGVLVSDLEPRSITVFGTLLNETENFSTGVDQASDAIRTMTDELAGVDVQVNENEKNSAAQHKEWLARTQEKISMLGLLSGEGRDSGSSSGGESRGSESRGEMPGFAAGTRGLFVPMPKSFRVGEAGPEEIETSGGRMRVTPSGGGGGDGGGKTIQNFNFNISTIDGPSTEKFMREQAMPFITAMSRTGNFTIHSGAVVN